MTSNATYIFITFCPPQYISVLNTLFFIPCPAHETLVCAVKQLLSSSLKWQPLLNKSFKMLNSKKSLQAMDTN